MKSILELPHQKEVGTCYINGLYDILAWRGASYNYFLLPVIGGMAGFAYRQFRKTNPPKIVYRHNSSEYLLKELSGILGYEETVIKGHSWKSTCSKIIQSLNNGIPVLAGGLDMFHLPYSSGIYGKLHIPICHILIVGFDDTRDSFLIHDCDFDDPQEVPLKNMKNTLSVDIPGLYRKNTIRFFKLPEYLPDEYEVARKGLIHKAHRMLKPPVTTIGIPAMKKLAEKITQWNCRESLRHMESKILINLGNKYGKNRWILAGRMLAESGDIIIRFCETAIEGDLFTCGDLKNRIANIEEAAFQSLLPGTPPLNSRYGIKRLPKALR